MILGAPQFVSYAGELYQRVEEPSPPPRPCTCAHHPGTCERHPKHDPLNAAFIRGMEFQKQQTPPPSARRK